jgi:hypothetical protein
MVASAGGLFIPNFTQRTIWQVSFPTIGCMVGPDENQLQSVLIILLAS